MSLIANIIVQIQLLLNSVVRILIILGVVYFVWGVVQYMIAGGDEAKKEGRDRIIYGIIGLAVIVSLWGLVNLVVSTFGLQGYIGYVPTLVPVVQSTASSACSMVGVDGSTKFPDVLNYVVCIINNSIIPFIFALAVLMFLWGAVRFFFIDVDEAQKREQGRQFMIWGIIALTVMLGVWGLVAILGSTFGLGSALPQVRPPGATTTQ